MNFPKLINIKGRSLLSHNQNNFPQHLLIVLKPDSEREPRFTVEVIAQMEPCMSNLLLRSLCPPTIVHCNKRLIDNPDGMAKTRPDDQLYIVDDVVKVGSERGIV